MSKIYAIRNNSLKGIYTKEELKPEWRDIKGLSMRAFNVDEMEKAKMWSEGIEVPHRNALSAEEKQKIKESKDKARRIRYLKEDIITIKNLKKSLEEDNIIIGFGEDCQHKNLQTKMNYIRCPWDTRVLYGCDNGVTFGCYYRCSKNSEKILQNKAIYLRAIDTLIENMTNNPSWGTDSQAIEGILNKKDIQLLEKWDKKREEIRHKQYEIEERYKEKNLVRFIGCPEEMFRDLKKLADLKILVLEDYTFEKDKILLDYYDYTDCSSELIEMNTDMICFEMMPDMESKQLEITLGPGGWEIMFNIPFTNKNKKHLMDFYNKWRKFKKDNPDLYNEYSYNDNVDNIDNEENFLSNTQNIDCEVCLFYDHCNGLYCLKGDN